MRYQARLPSGDRSGRRSHRRSRPSESCNPCRSELPQAYSDAVDSRRRRSSRWARGSDGNMESVASVWVISIPDRLHSSEYAFGYSNLRELISSYVSWHSPMARLRRCWAKLTDKTARLHKRIAVPSPGRRNAGLHRVSKGHSPTISQEQSTRSVCC